MDDAVGQAQLVASGAVSSVELLEAAITRLESARPLNAVVTDLFDRGREQARRLDESGALRTGTAGPLAGVPFLLKDLGASLAGAPEAMGSRALRSHVADQTAWIVQRYLDAGLVIFGKTNTPEWGNHCTTEPSLFGCAERLCKKRSLSAPGRWQPFLIWLTKDSVKHALKQRQRSAMVRLSRP